jgi:calcium-independent phospholipase A2-gamma
MLGRLEMDIETCIDAFTEMMDEIFQRKHKFPFELSGKVRGRYSSVTLEKCIKKVITDAGFPVDAKMRDQAGKKYPCKT